MRVVAPPVEVETYVDERGNLVLCVEIAGGKLHRLPMSVRVDEDALKCRYDRGKSLLTITAPIICEADPIVDATKKEDKLEAKAKEPTKEEARDLCEDEEETTLSATDPESDYDSDYDSDRASRTAEEKEPEEGDHIFDPLYRVPPEKANPALKLTQIPGAGKGYIARRLIRRGEIILIEKSITPMLKMEDQRDAEGMIARLVHDPGRFKQLLLDIEAMVPAAEEIPAVLREEAKTAMGGKGVAVDEDVIRLYSVFKCNAFEGGLYPHMARFNHACNPSCVYVYKAGRIEASARRDIPQGEQVTISYRNCESRFPGLPWGVYAQRQSSLRSGYLFDCHCQLCTQGLPGFESLLCNHTGGCKGEVRPTSDGTLAPCDACGGRLKSDQVWSGLGGKVVAFVIEMEEAFETFRTTTSNTRQCVALLSQCDGSYKESRELLHPHHIALYRLRALLVDMAQHIKADPVVHFEDDEFSALMVDCLTHLDLTAIHLHGELDLMRLPILKMKQAICIHQRMVYGSRPALEEEKRQQDQAIAALGPPHEALLCSSCGARAACSLELLSCGKCGSARYCNKACQKVHWKAHKKGCGK